MADGKTREQILKDMGFRTVVVPKLDSQSEQGEGIQSVRDLLPMCYFDRDGCENGVKALDNFQKEWDDRNGIWKDRYKHNWASHAAKALEQFARGHRPARIAGKRNRQRGAGVGRRASWKTA
jgi:hypothetical protein